VAVVLERGQQRLDRLFGLTTMRCSQVDSLAWPSKRSSALKAEMNDSCTTSRASSSEPTMRRATASRRGDVVRTSVS
jgi:hypothetical protein